MSARAGGVDVAEPAVRAGDFALVMLGAVLWGGGGLAGSALADSVGTGMPTVAAVRLLVGGSLLLVLLAALGRLGRSVAGQRAALGAAARRVAVTGLLAAAYQSSYFLAVALTGVAPATIVALGASPVLVAAASAVLRRRAPGGRVLSAVGLALVGLVLLVGGSAQGGSAAGEAGSGGTRLAGLLLALAAAAAFATMTLVNRRPVPGLGPLTLTGASFTLGGLVLCPVALVADGLPHPAGAEPWLLALFLGAGPTAGAYAAYFAGLRTVPATSASLLALLEPLTATIGAAVLLGERVGPAGVAGGLAMAVAVVLLRPRRAETSAARAAPDLAYDGRRVPGTTGAATPSGRSGSDASQE